MFVYRQKGGQSAVPSVSSRSQPAKLIKAFSPMSAVQENSVRVLVVSPELETRQALLRTLEAFPADVIVCSNRAQAEEVLSHQSFDLVFCDAHLSDGSFEEVIRAGGCTSSTARVIVTVRERDGEFTANAIAQGACAVVRWPGFATDVELAMLRALRKNERAFSAVA